MLTPKLLSLIFLQIGVEDATEIEILSLKDKIDYAAYTFELDDYTWSAVTIPYKNNFYAISSVLNSEDMKVSKAYQLSYQKLEEFVSGINFN